MHTAPLCRTKRVIAIKSWTQTLVRVLLHKETVRHVLGERGSPSTVSVQHSHELTFAIQRIQSCRPSCPSTPRCRLLTMRLTFRRRTTLRIKWTLRNRSSKSGPTTATARDEH